MRIGNWDFLEDEIQLIQELAVTYRALSRKELAFTICENLNWKNEAGNLKVDSCLELLRKMEATGRISLNPLQKRIHIKKEDEEHFNFTNTISINGTVDNFNPYIEIVREKEENKKWNDLVQRYHYLGYKKNFGLHLKYYICLEGIRDPVGCLSFVSTTTYHLKCRDLHIGWSKEQRERHLNWIINNNRFLIFPWIKIDNLGSKIFSLAAKQVPIEWEKKFNYKPVLFETYVDRRQFHGSIYKSANWLYIGQTSGNYNTKRIDRLTQIQCPKDVYIYPVEDDYKDILQGKKVNAPETKSDLGNLDRCIKELKVHESELDLWEKIQLRIALICKQVDERSMQRSQKVNALTILLALYRIVFAKNFESYSSLLCELLDAANAHGIRLAFREPIAASTFSEARKKFSPFVFKQIGEAINELYEENIGNKDYRWFGRRIFAIDGSKVNVPRDLMKADNGNYKLPCSHAFYPQGLISCLYQLKSRIAYDFSLVNTMNEQDEALKHLQHLKQGDVVVYDRGYLSYALLFMHKKLGIDAIFRLKSAASFKAITEFIKICDRDTIKSIFPTRKSFSNIKNNYPFIDKPKPYQLRLIKYSINNEEYYIGSTILDNEISINDYTQVYHGRWGHEEFYKSLKYHIKSIEFHGKNEKFIQQEIYAGFNILSLNRILSNSVEEKFEQNQYDDLQDPFHRKKKVNYKSQLDNFYRIVEPVIAGSREKQREVIQRTVNRSQKQSYKTRLSRKSLRVSHKHINKWQKVSN